MHLLFRTILLTLLFMLGLNLFVEGLIQHANGGFATESRVGSFFIGVAIAMLADKD